MKISKLISFINVFVVIYIIYDCFVRNQWNASDIYIVASFIIAIVASTISLISNKGQ